jgi:hypothetical protein
MAGREGTRVGIKDLFYETRVLSGREYTLRRFAEEALGGSVDPVMLGYVEKGKRFPSEALVRRLAVLRKQDPQELLAVLARDRILHAIGRELRRVLRAPRAVLGIEDAELAVRISQAIAALPDDGSWMAAREWRKAYQGGRGRGAARRKLPEGAVKQVEQILKARQLIELRGAQVRRRGRHFVAEEGAERQSLALEFAALFTKGLLDKLVLADKPTGTYLRNHYLNIELKRFEEFEARLDAAVRDLVVEFAADASPETRLLNVLVTATSL